MCAPSTPRCRSSCSGTTTKSPTTGRRRNSFPPPTRNATSICSPRARPARSTRCIRFAQGDGPPRGRELEIADLLRFIKTSGVTNTVWLTADVHYAAAHYYNPDKAQFQEFDPFWEFVSGPLHAGTFGPNELDNTFGPEVKFIKAPGLDKQNLPPSAGMQFFGHVKIDGASGQMTVTLRDRADVALWSTTLDPKLG